MKSQSLYKRIDLLYFFHLFLRDSLRVRVVHVLIVIILDNISHTKKILNMSRCSTNPTNFTI
jgi:hypothetical protein